MSNLRCSSFLFTLLLLTVGSAGAQNTSQRSDDVFNKAPPCGITNTCRDPIRQESCNDGVPFPSHGDKCKILAANCGETGGVFTPLDDGKGVCTWH